VPRNKRAAKETAKIAKSRAHQAKEKALTLADIKEGKTVVVKATQGDDVTVQALRFGIAEGSVVSIEKNIPGGPVIVSRNQMELAVGRQLAMSILVEHKENQ
jgi:Fe2+ transport system protein FeoA